MFLLIKMCDEKFLVLSSCWSFYLFYFFRECFCLFLFQDKGARRVLGFENPSESEIRLLKVAIKQLVQDIDKGELFVDNNPSPIIKEKWRISQSKT